MTRRWMVLGLVLAGSVLLLAALLGLVSRASVAADAPLRVCASDALYDGPVCSGAAQPGDVMRSQPVCTPGVAARAGLQQIRLHHQELTMRGGYSADFAAWDPALYPTTLDAEARAEWSTPAVTLASRWMGCGLSTASILLPGRHIRARRRRAGAEQRHREQSRITASTELRRRLICVRRLPDDGEQRRARE